MAFTEQAHENDIGTTFRVTVYDTNSDGTTKVADIQTATTKKMTFKKPNGDTFDRIAVFTSAGNWQLQAYVQTPDGSWRTNSGSFKVYENL
jgi:peptide methionine sulfoxide reductase MsrA